MINLDNYLNYLHEDAGSKFSVSGEVQSAVGQWALWSLLAVPATALAWKLANALFSKADRTCGGPIARRTPGFKICVSRERMKAFQKQISVAQKALTECRLTKNPQLCQQKWRLEIEKTKNKIAKQQESIKSQLGEQMLLQELGLIPAVGLADIAGFGIGIVTMDALDKAIFLVRRLTQASFDKSVRKCGIFKTNTQRQLCMEKIKFASQRKEMAQVSSLMNKCSRMKNDSEKCKNKIKTKLEKLRRNMQITQDNITSYTNTVNTEKREADLKSNTK
jgi:hypothetical protein